MVHKHLSRELGLVWRQEGAYLVGAQSGRDVLVLSSAKPLNPPALPVFIIQGEDAQLLHPVDRQFWVCGTTDEILPLLAGVIQGEWQWGPREKHLVDALVQAREGHLRWAQASPNLLRQVAQRHHLPGEVGDWPLSRRFRGDLLCLIDLAILHQLFVEMGVALPWGDHPLEELAQWFPVRRLGVHPKLSPAALDMAYQSLMNWELLGETPLRLVPGISGRHDTGSYYTPPQILQYLVRTSLEPIWERRVQALGQAVSQGEEETQNALEALSQIRVCDPCVGSGAFLREYLAQVKVELLGLEGLLAQISQEYPRLDTQGLLSRIGRNVFGADIHLPALVLARGNLARTLGDTGDWLLKNLRYGNSLLPPGEDPPEPRISWEDPFAVVLTNPPWEILQAHGTEFFRALDSQYRAGDARLRQAREEALLAHALVAQEYADYLGQIRRLSKYLRENLRHQWATTPLGRRSAKLNWYKVAVEICLSLVGEGGVLGMVTPLGICGDLTCKDLRGLLWSQTQWGPIYGLSERARVFPHAQQAVAVWTAWKGGETREICYQELESLAEFSHLPDGLSIPRSQIQQASPESWAIPALRGREDTLLLAKINSHPPLSGGQWKIDALQGDLNETTAAHLFSQTPHGPPLLTGEAIQRYRISQPFRPLAWVPQGASSPPRLVWRDVSNRHLPRRALAAWIPEDVVIGNSLYVITTPLTQTQQAVVLAILNSAVFEFWLRLYSSNNHLNKYLVLQTPAPVVSDDLAGEIFSRVWELSWGEGGEGLEWEVEALVALAYGLEPEDLAHLLGAFPRLTPREKEGLLGSFQQVRRNLSSCGEY